MRALRGWWLVLSALVLALVGGGITLLARDDKPAPLVVPAPSRSPDPIRTPLLAAPDPAAPSPTSAGLRRALAPALGNPALGRRVALSVIDAGTGGSLLERFAAEGVVPASTTKIATAVAALSVLPPELRFSTRVVAGARPGDVVLVGGGDPTLSGSYPLGGFPRAASLAQLAAALQRAGVPVGRVLVDDSLFAGPRTGPGWKPGYVSGGDVAPVSALVVDGGRLAKGLHASRSGDPALQAGRQLSALLGLRVPVARTTAATGAALLAEVRSPAVPEIVEAMLGRSDNDVAEALGRQVALHQHLPATFVGEAKAVTAALPPLVPGSVVRLVDASGLSPLNRIPPGGLSRLLATVSRDARYAALLSGLPVGGFDGTLAGRYRTGPAVAAAGEVRAKTGTLAGVSALAGLVRTRSGRLLAFDLTADGVPAGATTASQDALDRLAAVLASCGCA